MNRNTGPVLLHMIDTGGPGGAETVFLRLVVGLGKQGWGALPVVGRDNWLASQLRAERLEPLILNAKGSFNVRYLRALARLVKQHRVAGIVTHLYGSAIYGAVAGAITGVPVLSVFHGQSDIGAGERFGWLKAQLVGRIPRKLIAVSGGLHEFMAGTIRAPVDRWTVIPNGVDTSRITPGQSMQLRARLGISGDALLVGALGNIRQPKAYDVFLEVAARGVAEDPRCHFVVAGEGRGSMFEALLQARKALGIERNVHFLGSIEQVAPYLGDLDIFLLTSASEGFSLACVEAMACGLPVVATRSGGPEEIVVDGETGFLRPVGHIEALASAVGELASNPEMRQCLGSAARERAVMQFSLEGMIASYAQLIRDLLEPRI